MWCAACSQESVPSLFSLCVREKEKCMCRSGATVLIRSSLLSCIPPCACRLSITGSRDRRSRGRWIHTPPSRSSNEKFHTRRPSRLNDMRRLPLRRRRGRSRCVLIRLSTERLLVSLSSSLRSIGCMGPLDLAEDEDGCQRRQFSKSGQCCLMMTTDREGEASVSSHQWSVVADRRWMAVL